MEFRAEDEDVDDGVGPDTRSEEDETGEDSDEAYSTPAQIAGSSEPPACSLVCRNNVNTFVVRLKSYPWFSA
jgi:hypothetical protein